MFLATTIAVVEADTPARGGGCLRGRGALDVPLGGRATQES
jgi:hypothetical protein